MKSILFRLSIRLRMGLILLTFVLPTAFISWQLVAKLNEAISFSEREAEGSIYIQPLFTLLDEVADYQISAIKARDGNAGAQKDMTESSEAIDRAFNELSAMEKRSAEDLGLTADKLTASGADALNADSLRTSWQTIKTSKPYDAPAYKALLSRLRKLIVLTGDTSGMVLDVDLDSYYLVDAIFGVYPQTSELLAAAKNDVYELLYNNKNAVPESHRAELQTHAVLIRDFFLAHAQKSISTSLENDKDYHGVSPTLAPTLKPRLDAYSQGGTKLVGALQDLAAGKSLQPDKFVEIADVMHDGTSELAVATLQELDKLLSIRVSDLKADRMEQLGSSGAALLIGFILFFFISASIAKPIAAVQSALTRIAEGETDFETKVINGTDEISQLTRVTRVLKDNVAEAYRLKQIIQDMPTNVMTVDVRNDFKIDYMNNTLRKTLQLVQSHFSFDLSQAVGKPFDIFHKHPEHQRRRLADPKNLPHRAKIKVGPETMELRVSAINDKKGEYVGAMMTWNVITAQENLAADFEKDVKSIVNTVASAATQLSRTAEVMLQSVKQNKHMASEATQAASQTTANVQSVACATEELSASVKEISSQVQKASVLAQQSSERAASADRLAEQVKNASGRVNQVIDLISGVYGQIKLLALNATIESARAGEAGKGFAVVAGEVKNLASRTDESVVEVQKVVAQMREASDAITEAMSEITKSISDISSATSSVASAIEEQSATTNEISRNMQTAAHSTELIAANLDSVSTASTDASAASEEMLSASKELTHQSDKLNAQVDAFLMKVRAA